MQNTEQTRFRFIGVGLRQSGGGNGHMLGIGDAIHQYGLINWVKRFRS